MLVYRGMRRMHQERGVKGVRSLGVGMRKTETLQ